MKKDATKKILSKKSGRLIFAALVAVFFFVGLLAVYNLISTEREYSIAQSEYAELRQWVPPPPSPPAGNSSTAESSESTTEQDPEPEPEPVPFPDFTSFNPDYIGWIRIGGTDIDYPVVQGKDNLKYLNVTFMGERNSSGAIFLDSNCSSGFTGLALLHGHNMNNGTMFAGLHSFRDSDFLSRNNEINIFTPEGEMLTYSIFDVKITTANDAIFNLPAEGQEAFTRYFNRYGLDGHSIKDHSGILALSTCTSGPRNERLVVFAARQ